MVGIWLGYFHRVPTWSETSTTLQVEAVPAAPETEAKVALEVTDGLWFVTCEDCAVFTSVVTNVYIHIYIYKDTCH